MASSSPSILAAHTGQYGPHPRGSVWLFVCRPRRPRQLHSSGNSSLRFRVQAPGSLLKNRERHSRHCSTLPRSSVSLRSQDEIRPVMPGSLAGPHRAVRQARRHAVRGPRRLVSLPPTAAGLYRRLVSSPPGPAHPAATWKMRTLAAPS